MCDVQCAHSRRTAYDLVCFTAFGHFPPASSRRLWCLPFHAEPIHFLFPFLAHALGTFSGAVLAIKISKQTKIAYMIALVFLYGGISMITQVPSPMWFTVLDLVLAYIPMAWLATKISN